MASFNQAGPRLWVFLLSLLIVLHSQIEQADASQRFATRALLGRRNLANDFQADKPIVSVEDMEATTPEPVEEGPVQTNKVPTSKDSNSSRSSNSTSPEASSSSSNSPKSDADSNADSDSNATTASSAKDKKEEEEEVKSEPSVLDAAAKTAKAEVPDSAKGKPEPMVEPLKPPSSEDLKRLNASLSEASKDCLLSEWTDWSGCKHDKSSGVRASRERRERALLQPQLEGGKPCNSTEQYRTCSDDGMIARVLH